MSPPRHHLNPSRDSSRPRALHEQKAKPQSPRLWYWLGSAVVAVIVLGLISWHYVRSEAGKPQTQRPLEQAKRQLRRKQYDAAEKLAVTQAKRQLDDADESWVIAGVSAFEAKKYSEAIDHFRNVSDTFANLSNAQLRQAGEFSFHANSLEQSHRFYRRAVHQDSTDLEAKQRMLYLLGLSGRLWDAVPLLRSLLDENLTDQSLLALLGDHYRVADFAEPLRKVLESNPADSQALLGMARIEAANLRATPANEFLRRIHTESVSRDAVGELNACQGEVWFELQDWESLVVWQKNLTNESYQHPTVWRVLGKWAQQRLQSELAVHCFAKAFELDPSDRESQFRLAELITSEGDGNASETLRRRSQQLEQLNRSLLLLQTRPPRADTMLDAGDLCMELGRMKEAFGWYSIVSQGGGGSSLTQRKLAESKVRALRDNLATKLAWDSPAAEKLAQRFVVRKVDWQGLVQVQPSVVDKLRTAQDPLRWADVAQKAGFDFRYDSCPTEGAEGKRIFEFGGGGVGVLDYDLDGWPDLVMTQGCSWPPAGITSTKPVLSKLNQRQALFRNLSGQRFLACSPLAGVDLECFGQGIACGDIDNDGFDDLYLAAVGQNYVLRNNGDGTFSDWTTDWGLSGETKWTTSVAIADLNRDGLPDLYDANYLQGEEIFDRICDWEGGRKRICGPGTYDAAADTLWINTGEGFREATDESGIRNSNGKSLGILIGDLLGDGSVVVFVANDQTANTLFVPDQLEGAQVKHFADEAQLRGLAFDESGAMQGCMGIASGDFDQNGLLDLFVTNYVTESNTLYQQAEPGLFTDRTRAANLRELSIPMVGFGVQAVDSRLDGTLDLLVTNGHLDDFSFKSQMFQMPGQYFQNDGRGIFDEVGSRVSKYISEPRRGRSMARIDWNNDGLDDVAISNLDVPSALLENQSRVQGNYLSIILRGRTSNRNAIGTSVTISCLGKTHIRSLTAGDGYQCSNQQRLLFGLGAADVVEHIKVVWPSGIEDSYSNISAGNYVAVEELGLHALK